MQQASVIEEQPGDRLCVMQEADSLFMMPTQSDGQPGSASLGDLAGLNAGQLMSSLSDPAFMPGYEMCAH